MIIFNNIYFGHIPGTYIGEAIDHLGERISSTFQYATLLCVDSSRNITNIVSLLEIPDRFLPNPNQLFQCNTSEFHNIFFEYKLNINFSSVLYSQNILIEAVPEALKFTSEIPFSESEISKDEAYYWEIAKELTRLGQVLALGDGCGLNYATDIKLIAEQIEKMKQS